MAYKDKHPREGAIGTVVFYILLVLLLSLVSLKAEKPEGEEGILINFGTDLAGSGAVETARSTPPKKVAPPPPKKTSPPPKPQPSEPQNKGAEQVNTQDFEEAAAIDAGEKKRREEELRKKKKKEKERLEAERKQQKELKEQKRKEQEIERQRQVELEKQRQEEAERKRQEEVERKRQEELKRRADAIRNSTANAFGKADTQSSSDGNKGGTGNQGASHGSVNSKSYTGRGLGTSGNGFDLQGRSLPGGLPEPKYTVQEEGIVVVSITVDREGRVIRAQPIQQGSTTMNATLRRLAREAALKARFNKKPDASAQQKGTITYEFRLR